MKVFLLWRAGSPEAAHTHAPAPVAARLAARFAPLFEAPPEPCWRSVGAVHLAWIELPVKGFRAPFFEEGEGGWAFAPDYPLNARRILRAQGLAPVEGCVLRALGDELERHPGPRVRELIPPTCLVWTRHGSGPAQTGSVLVQNDGLGQAQLFEHEQEDLFALTNHVTALAVLGIPLRPVPEEWAARFITNWFPLDRTGYAGVRFLAGGTRLMLGPDGVRRTRHDPLDDWVRPEPRPRDEALELGRQGLLHALADAAELAERPTLGLSGGWDSRAVAACMRTLGADFDARVRGQEAHFDVIVSTELARIAGIPHRVKSEGGIPPDSAEGCRASVVRALLWQGGYLATKKHKNFLAKARRSGLDGGVVNVMGQHAGVGKADFVVRTAALVHPRATDEERLIAALVEDGPPFLREDRLGEACELIRSAYRAAHARGLTGLGPLLYFYLNEFTRRWGSATVASQTGLVVAPFLCPDVIRACYLLPPEELPSKPLHRFVTASLAPDWSGVPYADQLSELDGAARSAPESEPMTSPDLPRWRAVRHHRKYHYKYYWKDVGQPLLAEAFSGGGFWSEIFDPDLARTGWMNSSALADCLVVAHLLPKVLGVSSSLGAPLPLESLQA